jgi:hypothetical protein
MTANTAATLLESVKMEPVYEGWYRVRKGELVAYMDGIELHFAADDARQALTRAEWSLNNSAIDWRTAA